MRLYGQRVKVAKVNLDYELNMMSKDKDQYICKGSMVLPYFISEAEDHILDHFDKYIDQIVHDSGDELLGGTIVVEFLGISPCFNFMVIEKGVTEWTNLTTGTETVH